MDIGAFFDQFFEYCVANDCPSIADEIRTNLEQLGRNEITTETFMQLFGDAKDRIFATAATAAAAGSNRRRHKRRAPRKRRVLRKIQQQQQEAVVFAPPPVPQSNIDVLLARHKCTEDASNAVKWALQNYIERIADSIWRVMKDPHEELLLPRQEQKQEQKGVRLLVKPSPLSEMPVSPPRGRQTVRSSAVAAMDNITGMLLKRKRRQEPTAAVVTTAATPVDKEEREKKRQALVIDEAVLLKAMSFHKKIPYNRDTWKRAGVPIWKMENLLNY